jgi:hypothetical protein
LLIFSSIKLEKREEQVLPGSEAAGGKEEGVGRRGEIRLKQRMYM